MRIRTAYGLFVGLSSFGIGTMVTGYVPFLLSIGLSLGQVELINGICAATTALSEIPTGLFADGRGRAWSLAVGSAIVALSFAVYTFAIGPWSALAGELLFAVGVSFTSGAQQAWLADALKAEGELHLLPKAFGTATIIRGIATIVGGVAGSFIDADHARLMWLPGIVCFFLAALIAHGSMRGRGEPEERLTEREALCKAFASLRESRSLQWLMACLAAYGLIVGLNHFWSPYCEELFGRHALGSVWAIMYFAFIPAGLLIRRYGAGRHEAAAVTAVILATGATLVLLPFMSSFTTVVLVLAINEFPRGAFEPLTDAYVHTRVESGFRATAGSLKSLVTEVGFTIAPFGIWVGIRDLPNGANTIRLVWIVLGSLLVLSSLALWLFRPREG